MSLFSWFSRKPSPSKPRSPIEPSGLLNADATVPLAVGRNPVNASDGKTGLGIGLAAYWNFDGSLNDIAHTAIAADVAIAAESFAPDQADPGEVASLLALGYHHACARILGKFVDQRNTRSHRWFRFFNEVPVLALVAVCILVVVKPF